MKKSNVVEVGIFAVPRMVFGEMKKNTLPCLLAGEEKRGWEGLLYSLRLTGANCSTKPPKTAKVGDVTIM
jgi:hypothetical protein